MNPFYRESEPNEDSKQPRKRPSFFNKILTGKSRSASPSASPPPVVPEPQSSSEQYGDENTDERPITLHGYKPNTKRRLMDEELANNIRNLMPPRLQLYDDWDLVYDFEQDGISLNTLYRNSNPEYQLQKQKNEKQSKGYGDGVVKSMIVGDIQSSTTTSFYGLERKRPQGYVMVIQDEKRNKFGCYLNTNLRAVDNKRYYGNGECFLWKLEKYDASKLNHEKDSEKGSEKDSEKKDANLIDLDDHPPTVPKHKPRYESRFKAFMYTGMNDNIIFSNHDFIAIGSSNGQNGLWIDKSLYKGVSYPCTTFGNEILNLHNSDSSTKLGTFKVIDLEVWRVGALE